MQSKQPKQFTTSDHNNNENSNNNRMNSKNNNNNNNNVDMFGNEQSFRPQSIKNHNDIERNRNELQQRKKFSTPRSISSSVEIQQINNCDEYAAKVNIEYKHTYNSQKCIEPWIFSRSNRLYSHTPSPSHNHHLASSFTNKPNQTKH